MWKEYQKMSKEFTSKIPLMTGKWHYHYENKNGRIGLIKLMDIFPLGVGNKKLQSYCYEACGVLNFKQFYSLKDAEKAIYKELKEKYQK